MPRRKIMKGGENEMKDFFKMFSFDEMRTKTKKGKKESNGFINRATKTIKKKSKNFIKATGLNKLHNKVAKTSRNTAKNLIKKRPRKKLKKNRKSKNKVKK